MSRFYARKRGGGDLNTKPIVARLEAIGANVLELGDIGGGCPDLLVSWRGKTVFLEVKNPDNWYGRSGLTPAQQVFAGKWATVPTFVVRTVVEALAAVGAKENG